jgi:hypothetical protein
MAIFFCFINPSTESGSYERYQGGPGSIFRVCWQCLGQEEYVTIINL